MSFVVAPVIIALILLAGFPGPFERIISGTQILQTRPKKEERLHTGRKLARQARICPPLTPSFQGGLHTLKCHGAPPRNRLARRTGTSHFEPNIDSIGEMRVLTSNYQAEYGPNSNAIISIVTKGGGQEFHGSAWANKLLSCFPQQQTSKRSRRRTPVGQSHQVLVPHQLQLRRLPLRPCPLECFHCRVAQTLDNYVAIGS